MQLVVKGISHKLFSNKKMDLFRNLEGVTIQHQGHLINLVIDNNVMAKAIFDLIIAQAKLYKT